MHNSGTLWRRTVAYKMFAAVHIAPSHRRPPILCGMILSVSLLISCLEMEWIAISVQCKTGNKIREVHSPISAQAKQKSTEPSLTESSTAFLVGLGPD